MDKNNISFNEGPNGSVIATDGEREVIADSVESATIALQDTDPTTT